MSTLEVGPGTSFGGDFVVVRPLRVGGMGAVYVAEQRSTSMLRALKVMQRELVSDPSLRERFEQEARVGAQIESDHVVSVVGAGIDATSGLPWIAMELLKGMPLDLYLAERGPRTPGEVCFLFEQLCHALGAAHERGIVHRDLKPANVFLSTSRVVGLSYVVKVLDFGIAKVLAEAKTTKTAAVGTPLYMAPEQYEAGRVTPATDVWALGLIAFELLTGRSYWKAARDGNATPASIMYETCLGDLAPPSNRVADLGLRAALPDGFDAWFARCVQRQPELRFLDARAAFESLAAVLGAPKAPTEPLPAMREAVRTPQTLGMAGAPVQATEAMTAAPTPAPTPATRPLATEIARTEIGAAAAQGPASIEPKRRKAADYAIFGTAAVAVAAIAFGIVMLARGPSSGGSSNSKEPGSNAPVSSTITMTSASTKSAAPLDPTQFSTGTTVVMDGRLLHKKVIAGSHTETYVMLDLRGADIAPKVQMPVHLSLVIDRSGSMKGGRLDNAIAAANGAIERLRDGDQISVIAFAETAETIVAPTSLDSSSRATITAAVKKIALGGNTCISCGLAMALDKLGTSADTARRILLLSDGEANLGVKDIPGFEKIARDAQKTDVAITTIGVGQDYDPKSLVALSKESNGMHYYAANEAALPGIFDAQAKAMASVVAMGAEASIHLAPGVKLVSVLDRVHRIDTASDGTVTVHVPLGQFTRNERKTVLVKVALESSEPEAKVGEAELAYREVGSTTFTKTFGVLAAPTGTDGSQLDPVVETRVQRSETAAALLKANQMFEAGKTKEASSILATQSKALEAQKKKWGPKASVADNPYAGKDVDAQKKSIDEAKGKYDDAAKEASAKPTKPGSPPPAMAPAAKAANKKAAEDAWNAGY